MAPDNVPPNNRHLMGHSEFLHGLMLICLPLNISEKLQARRGRDSSTSSLLMWYNTHAFWRATSNIELLNKRGSPPYFHSDNNLVLGNALVHPFEKNPVQVVTVELIWLLFLKILSFNFLQTLSKSLRFRKFRRSNVHHFVVVQTNYFQVTLLFLLDVRFPKRLRSLFCGCLSPTIVHLRNLFLLSTPVAKCWLQGG